MVLNISYKLFLASRKEVILFSFQGCRNFNATGSCVPQCPPERIYDRANFKIIDNPDVLYGLGNECLNKCPSKKFDFFNPYNKGYFKQMSK